GAEAVWTLPWIGLVMAGTGAVACASWAERRYFLPPIWCLWILACLAAAARRRATAAGAAPRVRPMNAAALGALALTAASYPLSAWRAHGQWPPPSPAYATAGRWADAVYDRNVRIAVTGGRETILLSVRTPPV